MLAQPDGERRLSNLLHLGELLQHAEQSLQGEHALVRHLGEQIQSQHHDSDAQQARLETDALCVKVITYHKSKGLQYPLVCLPFACSFREKERKTTRFVDLPAQDGSREVLLHYDDAQLALADADRLREDLRLLYVALTRARRKLVVIGDSATIAAVPFYKEFIRYAEEKKAYRSVWES